MGDRIRRILSCMCSRVCVCVHMFMYKHVLNSVGVSIYVCGEMYLCFFSEWTVRSCTDNFDPHVDVRLKYHLLVSITLQRMYCQGNYALFDKVRKFYLFCVYLLMRVQVHWLWQQVIFLDVLLYSGKRKRGVPFDFISFKAELI